MSRMAVTSASSMIRAWAQAVEPHVFARSELDGAVAKILAHPDHADTDGRHRYLIFENRTDKAAVITLRLSCASGNAIVYQIALTDAVHAFEPPQATADQLETVSITAVRRCG
jgi:hypothetical protein